MRKWYPIILCLTFVFQECVVEDAGVLSGPMLVRIEADGKADQTFEYQGEALVKENYYGFCATPSDEYTYEYSGYRLNKITARLRGLYSSIAAICDPNTGIEATEYFDYNNDGTISRATRSSTTIDFTYENGRAVKMTIIGGQNSLEWNYAYDSNGNLIEEIDQNGNTTIYKYDDKINPFFQMKQRPSWISPFNKSPNNVVKAVGARNFERLFKYNGEGFPIELYDTNNVTYYFFYQ